MILTQITIRPHFISKKCEVQLILKDSFTFSCNCLYKSDLHPYQVSLLWARKANISQSRVRKLHFPLSFYVFCAMSVMEVPINCSLYSAYGFTGQLKVILFPSSSTCFSTILDPAGQSWISGAVLGSLLHVLMSALGSCSVVLYTEGLNWTQGKLCFCTSPPAKRHLTVTSCLTSLLTGAAFYDAHSLPTVKIYALPLAWHMLSALKLCCFPAAAFEVCVLLSSSIQQALMVTMVGGPVASSIHYFVRRWQDLNLKMKGVLYRR